MLDGVCLQLLWQHRLHKILQIGSEHQGKGSSSPLCEHSQQKRSYASQGGHRFRYFELQARIIHGAQRLHCMIRISCETVQGHQ